MRSGSSPAPHLDVEAPKAPATAVALVLHGGRARGLDPVRPNQLAVLRMRPFASALQAAGAGEGLVVARLRYAVRGWNGAQRSPVADATWALDQLAERYPDRPIALVGHSMGGRTACYVAGHEAVVSVVALAAWLEADDPATPLTDRRVLFVHGDRDRVTSPAASAAYAVRAAQVAASVSYISVLGGQHAMLRRRGVWHELATGFVLGSVLPATSSPARETAHLLAQALAGVPSLAV